MAFNGLLVCPRLQADGFGECFDGLGGQLRVVVRFALGNGSIVAAPVGARLVPLPAPDQGSAQPDDDQRAGPQRDQVHQAGSLTVAVIVSDMLVTVVVPGMSALLKMTLATNGRTHMPPYRPNIPSVSFP